jgi:ribonucleoside-diphosphate reductase alpha chain
VRFAKLPPSAEHRGKGWVAHIPDAILHSNDREVYAAFIRGLFEADGTTNNGYVSWSTVTESFSRDVQSLLLALGFVTTRKVDDSSSNWGEHDGSCCACLRPQRAGGSTRSVSSPDASQRVSHR